MDGDNIQISIQIILVIIYDSLYKDFSTYTKKEHFLQEGSQQKVLILICFVLNDS